MKVLAIDTASAVCSVALWRDGALVAKSAEQPRAHADHVLPLVDAVLVEGAVKLSAIDRFAFDRGPGGLTGVRVAASVVQGFAFAFSRPVVAVSGLTAQAQYLVDTGVATTILACHDAGMGQLAWRFFAVEGGVLEPLGEERLSAPELIAWPAGPCEAVGSGLAQLEKSVVARHIQGAAECPAALAPVIAGLAARPDAKTLAALAAQPVYWRHPVTG